MFHIVKKKISSIVAAVLGLGALGTQASAQSSGWGSSDLGSSGNGITFPKPSPFNPHQNLSPELDVTKIGDLFGPSTAAQWGVGASDLGIMREIGTKEFAIIFGDSFRGNFGQGEWMSPIGMVATINNQGKIEFQRPLNNGTRVEQLVAYSHDDQLTLIPNDLLNVGGALYMHASWNKGIGNVQGTGIWKSTDQGKTWAQVVSAPSNYNYGMMNTLSWELGPDGYVYVMSSQFKREDDVYLSRFRPESITNRNAWEHYGLTDGVWSWSNEFKVTPILSNNLNAGEMSLRYIDGNWVLAMFNAATYSVEIRVAADIAREWDSINPAVAVLGGNWAGAQTPNNFAQLYGGYIAPGSTLANMNLVVSQWNTSNNRVYNSTQFNVRGVDKFFRIGASAGRISLRSVPTTPEIEVTEVKSFTAEINPTGLDIAGPQDTAPEEP